MTTGLICQYSTTMKKTVRQGCIVLAIILSLLSCKSPKNDIMIIWTDRPEFAAYAELFNHSQSKYHAVVEYKENPAETLISAKTTPDIVIGPWLKGEKARSRMIPVDYLFHELRINSQLFYPSLLDLGNIGGRQFLLPVSFNLPALIFSPNKKSLIPNDFYISLDEVQTLAGEFNNVKKGMYSRMGFSPRWNTEFMYLTTRLYNAQFEEEKKLFKWNKNALNDSIKYMRNWTQKYNSSIAAEDDFQFKYLYDPPYKLVTGDKSLFSYMSSDELLVLPQDKIQNIDFRWLTKGNRTPVTDTIIYMGICKKAPQLEAAEAFLSWFFNEKTQQAILEQSHMMGTMEHSFGISGGFSSLKPVNEKIFPLMYPSLLGQLPPANTLAVPQILPNNWEILKREILIPYLIDAVSAPEGQETSVVSLENRISTWRKNH